MDRAVVWEVILNPPGEGKTEDRGSMQVRD